MGLVRLKIKEFAAQEGWTIKEVSERSGVPYGTVKTYARWPERSTVDLTALKKLAQAFNVLLEDLFEVVEQ
jgi:putative transcriptional regulator